MSNESCVNVAPIGKVSPIATDEGLKKPSRGGYFIGAAVVLLMITCYAFAYFWQAKGVTLEYGANSIMLKRGLESISDLKKEAITSPGNLRSDVATYDVPIACVVSYPSYVGDGYCDSSAPYNTPECNWDGGDCCPGTCVSTAYTCGVVGYNCLDPSQIVPPCAYPTRKGDGICDQANNIPSCDYDGGDCCKESCKANPKKKIRNKCGRTKIYRCKDPAYSGDAY